MKSRSFTMDMLEHSQPLDPNKRLNGAEASSLVSLFADHVLAVNPRTRALRQVDFDRLSITTEILLANLLSATQNRVDEGRFIAVSFNRNHYTQSTFSLTILRRLRDALDEEGFIEGQRGFLKRTQGRYDFGRQTRMRATAKLKSLFNNYGVNRGSLTSVARQQLIVLKNSLADAAPPPKDVLNSRETLLRINSLVSQATIELPLDAWARVRRRYIAEPDPADKEHRVYSGDTSATSMYRSFTSSWERGGRLYGGWWINIPKNERVYFSINGSQTVEVDYARLHPTLLFARKGIILDFDPYVVPDLDGASVRDLGKRTFNRLINKITRKNGTGRISLRAMRQDLEQLPECLSFTTFLDKFVRRLEPIAEWFGTGEGLILQREDSDLAIRVLELALSQGILVLPVHDSFIAPIEQRADLVSIMETAFNERYGFIPQVR